MASKESLDAVELALALLRAPRRLEQARRQALPAGVGRLFRIAGQDEAALAEVTTATGAKNEELVDAAFFFIEGVLLNSGGDSYRVLGLDPGAPAAQVKEHHRLLIRLMHPDRSRDNWTDVYAQRINQAWNDLRTPERRAAVDQLRAATVGEQAPELSEAEKPRTVIRPAPDGHARTPGRRIANLPQWVLAVIVVLAVGGVATIYLESRVDKGEDDDSEAPIAAAPATSPGAVAPAPASASRPPTPASPQDEAPRADAALGAATPPPTVVGSDTPSSSVAPSMIEPGKSAPLAAGSEPQRDTSIDAAHGAQTAEAARTESKPAMEMSVAPAARTAAAVRAAVPDKPHAEPAQAANNVPKDKTPPASRQTTSPAGSLAATSKSSAAAARRDNSLDNRVANTPRPSIPPLSENEIEAVLSRFQDAYGRGDLNMLMSLFSADARNNRGGLDAIAEDYGTFFRTSAVRNITFDDLHIFLHGEEGTATARFSANVIRHATQRPTRVTGRIQFDLRRDGQMVSVSRLLHEEG